MAKTKISNGDLMALFFVEMRQSPDFPIGMHVAIIPEGSGWDGGRELNTPHEASRGSQAR